MHYNESAIAPHQQLYFANSNTNHQTRCGSFYLHKPRGSGHPPKGPPVICSGNAKEIAKINDKIFFIYDSKIGLFLAESIKKLVCQFRFFD